MPKTNITQYSSTPSSNTDINSINIDENCPASGLNNAIRELMAHLKNVDTGSQALTALSVAGSVTATTSLKTPLIEFTDGDNALTIADGGNVTANADLTVSGAFTSQGIDDNADATAITIDSSENVGVGGTPNNFGGMTRSLEIKGTSDVELSLHATSDSMSDGARIGQIVFNAGSDSTVPTVSAIKGSVSGTDENKGILTFHTRNTDTGGLPSERLRINNSGDVMIGTTTVDLSAVTSGNGTTITSSGQMIMAHEGNNMFYMNLTNYDGGTENFFVFMSDASTKGSIGFNGSSTSYNTSSDHRLKESVTYDFDATTRLKQLKPCRFNFIDNADTTVDGFLAHEVQTIVPEAITGTHNEVEVWKDGEELPDGVSVGDNKLDEDGNTIPVYQGIDQSKLVPLLVKTIQELEARITALENA